MNLKELALQGLKLVNQNTEYAGEQIIYLDFDGANNVTYDNDALNIHISGINVADSGLNAAQINQILTELNTEFAGTEVVFTAKPPESSFTYSTIYIGGNDSASLSSDGFIGLSETIDVGNQIKNDDAFVFSDKINTVSALSDAIAHESGHLIGYEHADSNNNVTLADFALDKHLITFTTWNQDGPYNNLCPVDPLTLQRSVVGCVATAYSQVLYYWKATTKIDFSAADSYVTETRKIKIDQDASTYQFPNFSTLNTLLSSIKYDFSDQEKAALSLGVGIKVKMDYSSDMSGADSIAEPFKQAFGFVSVGMVGSKERNLVSNEMISVLADNISNGRPVIAGISKTGENGGHEVILDGYRSSDNYFHVNLGWGGIEDGWYSLTSIAGYNVIDEFLLDIFPTGEASATYTVTNTNDYGAGSLRRAIEMANNKTGADTIVFDASMSGKTITLTSGEITIKEALTITGLGKDYITVSGGWSGGSAVDGSEIFYVSDGNDASKINVSISGLTLTSGNSDLGGAIYNEENLTVTSTTITNSQSKDYGGAICSKGSMTVTSSLITGNKAVNGGGIASQGNLTLTDSLVNGNTAGNQGGGVAVLAGAIFKSVNSTISGNSAVSNSQLFAGSNPTFIATVDKARGDFSGDGAGSILWQNQISGIAGIWAGGTNWQMFGVADPNVWNIAGIGDFNGNGKSDILWQNKNDGFTGMWESGTNWQAFGSASLVNWEIVGVGDFNGNGTSDILWQNKNDGFTGMWESGTTWQAFGAASRSNWEVVGVGDFNGNGTSDILWQNKNDGFTGMWESGTSWQAFGGASRTDWEIAGVGDFNGNCTSDILWQNKNDGFTGMWESGTNWQAFGAASRTEWEVAGVSDFNGNITSDILWRNKQDGFAGMWESGTSWLAFGGASNDWKICLA